VNLYRLSLISIAACLVGLVALLAMTVHSARQMDARQNAIADLLALGERIDAVSAASDSLLLLGADPGLWQGYLAETQSLREELERLGDVHPDARKAAHRMRTMTEAVDAALAGIDAEPGGPGRALEPLDMPMRARIIMQQVANQGIALDTALDDAVDERQRSIAREARWIGATLAGSALLFGALCVVAFGLIHRRMALPARSLVSTLERIRAGDTRARAAVTGNDELSRLAETLNTLLDERQAADARLRERQRRLETALSELESTRDRLVRAQSVGRIGSWEVDLADQRLHWSDQVYEIFGIAPEDFEGTEEAFLTLVHPDDREALLRQRGEWLERGGDLDIEHRIVRPDGNVRWVRERARVIAGPDGTPTNTTGTVQDMTEQRAQQARIGELQKLVEGSEDLCGIVDDAYRYRWVNQAYLDRYGLSREEIEGRLMEEVLGEAYFRSVVKPRVDRCLAGEAQRFETERTFPEGDTRKLLARYYPIDVPGAAHRRAGAVITDVTSIRKAEAEVAHQARLLELAGRAARFGGWSVDLEDDTCTWSDVTAEIHGMPHGYSPTVDEGIGFYAPEYRDRIRERFTACAEHGQPYDEELQIIDADGRRRWVRTVGEPVRDGQGNIIKVQGAFQDITESRQLKVESERLANRLAAMLGSITDGFVAFGEDWRYVYVNAEGARMLGRTEQDLLGASLWAQFPELAGTTIEDALRRAMEARESASAEEYFEPLDTWFEMRAYPWQEGIAVFFRDVTERHRMVETLKRQEADLRRSRDALDAALATRQALINSLPAHIALLDREANIIDVNRQWRHYGASNDNTDPGFGISSNYIAICEAATGECSDGAGEVAAGLREVLAGQREVFTLEYPCHSPEAQRWFRVMFNRLAADPKVSGGAVAMHVDVTERKLAEQQLEKLAYEDPVTGLLSRGGFARRLRARLDEAGWPTDDIVAMVDVVNQRDINDAHGYATGDRLLTALGRRIRDRCSENGLAARAGGDEFIVVLAPASGQTAEDVLGELRRIIRQPFELDGVVIEAEFWMGFTQFGARRREPEDLIREAELALFENRKRATSQQPWLGFTPALDEQTRQRIRLTGELRDALEADQFELHFQPKVDLADGRLIAAEALLRWHHPERGLQPPGLFIPIAEQSQLIGPIGDWTLRDACRQLSEWRAAGLEGVHVSVNVSLVQFTLGNFPAKVRAALDDFGIPPSALTLEITESVFERQSDELLADIRALHELGVGLSLDDFGTGYSSLIYLQRYPFDEIKIDRAFVSRLLEDDYSRNIVRSVIDVAEALEAKVVAEGIEAADISAALLAMGCQIGQGFYYSVPLEAEDFRWLLEKRSNLPLKGGPRR